jgi:hypothetical protein
LMPAYLGYRRLATAVLGAQVPTYSRFSGEQFRPKQCKQEGACWHLA